MKNKPIKISIPFGLSAKDEVNAISERLIQKKLSGKGVNENKKQIGDRVDVHYLEQTIIVKRVPKEKIIEYVKCSACNCDYQSDLFFPVFVNYGGKNKKLKFCSVICQENVIDLCGEGRASKKNNLKPLLKH